MAFNIVLIEPEIPNNTGNIGRLSLASGCNLHLVKPLGFDLDEKAVRRAGLDYWKNVPLSIHENATAFFEKYQNEKMAFFSSHGKSKYTELQYEKDMFLIFGKESVGLGDPLREKHEQNLFHIPLFSKHIRSLNLANSVGIIVYEGLRQIELG